MKVTYEKYSIHVLKLIWTILDFTERFISIFHAVVHIYYVEWV